MQRTKVLSLTLLFQLSICVSSSFALIEESNSDLWDVTQGSTVTNDSGALNWNSFFRSDTSNMFGNALPGTCCDDQAIFADRPQGFVHFVEWNTSHPINLRSFVLSANHDGAPRDSNFRGFSRFSLFAKDPVTGAFDNLLFEIFPALTYGDTPPPPNAILETDQDGSLLNLWANVPPTTAQSFRAEFVQRGSAPDALGPRILELDGFDFFAVPEPAVSILAVMAFVLLDFLCNQRGLVSRR